jgi:cytidylate kinase
LTGSSSLDELVGRQVRRWEMERRAPGLRPAPPCVALSRLAHSGAAELGRQVAGRLGYGFFGSEIVDQIAREHGVQRRLLEGLDEKVRSAVDRYVGDAFRSGGFTESEYLRWVVRTVATLGEQGGAVILGRGAPFILSPERALRVLVIAPREQRIERLQKSRELTRAQAVEVLDREDAERLRFVRHHFDVNADDPLLFDLVVNSGTLGIADSAAAVVDALSRRFGL